MPCLSLCIAIFMFSTSWILCNRCSSLSQNLKEQIHQLMPKSYPTMLLGNKIEIFSQMPLFLSSGNGPSFWLSQLSGHYPASISKNQAQGKKTNPQNRKGRRLKDRPGRASARTIPDGSSGQRLQPPGCK